MAAKRVHDAAAFIRGLAQQRGRNAEWAERAVREAVSLTAAEALREGRDRPRRRRPAGAAGADRRPGACACRAASVTLATAGLRDRRCCLPDARQRLLAVIANPSFALVLMMIGIYGLIFEFSSPGFGVRRHHRRDLPAAGGLFALQMLPVNYAGLALVAAGHWP